MKFFQELVERFRSDSVPSIGVDIDAVRRARWDGDYEHAASLLSTSLLALGKSGEGLRTAMTVIEQAEILILHTRYQQAEELLHQTLTAEQSAQRKASESAALTAFGMLHQARTEWDEAREAYEKARKAAQQAVAPIAEARAMGGLADTYLHEDNASYALYLLREALPRLLEAGEMEWGSYYTGRMGEAQIASGREPEGQELLMRALRLAESYHIRPMQRLWSVRLGGRALREGRYADSRMHFQTALPLFPDTSSPERIAALCGLSTALLHHAEPVAALESAQQALNLITESTDRDIHITAQRAYGVSLHANGRSAAAIPYLTEAAEAAVGAQRCDLLRSLAAAQTAVADDEAAHTTITKAVALARTLPTPLDLAICLRDQGILFERLKKPVEAVTVWTEAVAIYEQHSYAPQVAALYCDIALARRKMGDSARAIKEFEQALMTLSAVEDLGTRGLVLANAAVAYSEQDVPTAESFFQESIAIAVRIGDTAAESLRRGNYGYFLLTTGRLQQATAVLEQVQRFSQTQGLTRNTALQTSNLGLTYSAMGNHSTAIQFHQQAFDLIGHIKDLYWETAIQINLATALIALNRSEAAEPLLLEALDVAQAGSFTESIISAHSALGRLAMHASRTEEALTYYQHAVDMARKYEFRYRLAEALAGCSETYAALGKQVDAERNWSDAQRLFSLLQNPQGSINPPWLKSSSPQSQ